MAATAKLSSSWKNKVIIFGILGLGLCIWGVYDGFVKYPEKNQAYENFQQVKVEWEKAYKSYQDQQKLDEWEAFAQSKGWPTEPMNEPPYSTTDIYTQYIYIGIGALIGLISFGRVFLNSRSDLIAGKTELTCAAGCKIPYDKITEVDKTKWDSKGIAMVHYDMDGKTGKVAIDDYKFVGAAEVVKEVEKRSKKNKDK